APAIEALEYQAVKFYDGYDYYGHKLPVYEQPPSDEVDKAWANLYKTGAVKITKSQASQLTNKTWPITGDTENYFVAFEIFHQLHCLDVLRQAAYRDHYNETESPATLRHCLAGLRQGIMCSVDISPIVWQWSDHYNKAMERVDTIHSCRNFERFQEWVSLHALDIETINLGIRLDLDL
ncbi:hypothetical protein M422DRAFT_187544, partial [Sphaerobolus stellatus SS14]